MVQHRSAPFRLVDELEEVNGTGTREFAELRPLVAMRTP
jgi:hypothetical protein